ncbi:MAG: lipoyl(octanoyl) transferase LipB [Alphaproteobacteria bacterium]|nr:lipoyl(octanoyl) transferase LipB [Alphaproteobacteria bacterium]
MTNPNPAIEWRKSGDLVAYPDACAFMETRVNAIHAGGAKPCIWLLEHPPLYTSGTSAKQESLLDATRFPVYATGRGGQFTYHGPGQRVAYVMLDMKQPSPFNHGSPDVRAYVTFLEQWIINTLAKLGLAGHTYADRVGVWVDDGKGSEAKIAAIGIRIRHWVSFHGIAINLCPDLSHFSGIVPCGITNYGVTSLHALGIPITMDELDRLLEEEFKKLYASATKR